MCIAAANEEEEESRKFDALCILYCNPKKQDFSFFNQGMNKNFRLVYLFCCSAEQHYCRRRHLVTSTLLLRFGSGARDQHPAPCRWIDLCVCDVIVVSSSRRRRDYAKREQLLSIYMKRQ